MYRTMKLSSSTVNLTIKESLKPTQRAQKQTFGWMLKTTIYNCSQKLRLQEKVSEPGTVDANVTPARQKNMFRTWCLVFLFLKISAWCDLQRNYKSVPSCKGTTTKQPISSDKTTDRRRKHRS